MSSTTTATTPAKPKVTTVLWFTSSTLALESATFYTSTFPSSSITHTQHYTDAGQSHHGMSPGDVMVISYTLFGDSPHPLHFANLNGGSVPGMHFTGAVSFQIDCEDQEEVDYLWGKLTEGGNPERQQCGWLEDRFGVAWQVVPRCLKEMLGSEENKAGAERAMRAMMEMKKMDIRGLEEAFEGVGEVGE